MVQAADLAYPLVPHEQRHATPPRMGMLPKVEVYVDEFGDRGFSAKSSPIFVMTAVLVPAESTAQMRVVAAGLRAEIRTAKPLHWVEHFTANPKHAHRRRLAADLVASIPGVTVVYVIAEKASMVASDSLRHDQDLFYNDVTKLLLERVAFQARNWPGGPRLAIARLSSIRGTRECDSVDFLDGVRDFGKTSAPLQFVKWPPRWYGPDRFDGLQIADLYTGMIGCALSAPDSDVGAAAHLLKHRHQIRRGPRGEVLGWGIKVYGDDAFVTRRAWWPLLSTKEPIGGAPGASTASAGGRIWSPSSG